ncbi:MAG: NACHT domain-containing protein [Anaerolineae bacterium]|jgi:hypothetical protein|nr:NACHT domain-containing protein [Anaerolineae bacterium]
MSEQRIYTDLIASGLIWIGTSALTGIHRGLGFGGSDHQSVIDQLYLVIDRVVRDYQTEYHPFLRTHEARLVVRQLYADHQQRKGALAIIRVEFIQLLAYFYQTTPESIRLPAIALFDHIAKDCALAYDTAVGYGLFSPQDAISVPRFRMLLDTVENADRTRLFLEQTSLPAYQTITAFEQTWREILRARVGYLIPPLADRPRVIIPIADLYVPQTLTYLEQTESEGERLTLTQMRQVIYRAVVLGDAGSGKSTLTQKLCHLLTDNDGEITPFLIHLRDYGVEREAHQGSLSAFIIAQIDPASASTIEYLLRIGRAMVICDGLDEITETSYRRAVTEDLEVFAQRFPATAMLITSRKVGYDESPLSKNRFERFTLDPFYKGETLRYARQWLTLTTADQQRKNELFLRDLGNLPPDLVSNPLILALLCNLYNDAAMPQTAPEVYRACSELLLYTWQRTSQGSIGDLRPTLAYLAHWIYENSELQSGVTERQLIAAVQRHFARQVGDVETPTRDLIAFCRGRSWVFGDVKHTDDGSPLYGFTHRTFLEYYTAEYLLTTHDSPQAFVATLSPRLAKREWTIVAELAFQRFSERDPQAPDRLITGLIDASRRKFDFDDEQQINLLWMAARCLGLFTPSTPTITALTEICLMRVIEDHQTRTQDLPPEGPRVHRLIQLLMMALGPNREIVFSVGLRFFQTRLTVDPDPLLLELALYFDQFLELDPLPRRLGYNEIQGFWDNFWRALNSAIDLTPYAQQHLFVANFLFLRDQLPLAALMHDHGEAALFETYQGRCFPRLRELSPFNRVFLSALLQPQASESLHELAEILRCGIPRPTDLEMLLSLLRYPVEGSSGNVPEVDSEFLFDFWICLAVIAETIAPAQIESSWELINDYYGAIFAPSADESLLDLQIARFAPTDRDLVRRWRRGEWRLING